MYFIDTNKCVLMFNDCPCHAVQSWTYMLSSDDLVHSAWSVKCKKKMHYISRNHLSPPPTPFEKKKLMQNSYHFQMHLAYILLMALFLWKFSAADLHWCSHGCSYYKIQGNKNVINKLFQTLKSNFIETFILGSITAPVFRKFYLMLFLSKKFSIEIQNV